MINNCIKNEKIMRKAHKIRIILPEKKIKQIVSLISIINWRFLKKYRKEIIISQNENNNINIPVYTINNMNCINYIEEEEFNDLDICKNIEEGKNDITPNVISIISMIEITNDTTTKIDMKI